MSQINVLHVLHNIIFLLGGGGAQKIDLFAPQGEITCTLRPVSRKNVFFKLQKINDEY